MNPPHRRLVALLVVVSGLIAACSLRPGASFRRKDTAEGASPVSAARYRGWISAGGRKASLRAMIYALPPDRLRVEILSPLGRPQMSILCRDEAALVLIPPERLYWQGGCEEPDGGWLGLPDGAGLWIEAMTADHATLEKRLGEPRRTADGQLMYARRYAEGGSVELAFDGPASPVRRVNAEAWREGEVATLWIERTNLLDGIDPELPFRGAVPEGFEEIVEIDLLGLISEEP